MGWWLGTGEARARLAEASARCTAAVATTEPSLSAHQVVVRKRVMIDFLGKAVELTQTATTPAEMWRI